MTDRLRCDITRDGDKVRATLTGDITEDADLSELQALDASELTLDLGGIHRINSCGVRAWMDFVAAIEKSGRTLVLEGCSVAFVRQLNMISNFRGPSTIKSVRAPYFCTACNSEQSVLLDLTKAEPRKPATTAPCPACGQTMEFDDVAESYLDFRT